MLVNESFLTDEMYAGKYVSSLTDECMLVNISSLTDEMYAGKYKFPNR